MNTAQLLKEWRSFLLNEHKTISRDELIRSLQRNNIAGKEIDFFIEFWDSNRFITKYTQVIQNELSTTQEPIKEILDVCKLHYEKIYQTAGPTLKDQIGGGNITIDELRKQIDSKSSFNKNEVRQQCSYQSGRPVVGNYQDFDIVYSESDWIVIEPKTIRGSIAWTHGKPDGSEETDQKRRSGWCTGVSTVNNMFPNYAGNLHMFYILNTDYDNDKSSNRRLCLSFTVSGGEAILEEQGGSTVNSANQAIGSELINRIIDENILDLIENRVSDRKETSFAEVYSKATLNQILRIEKQMNSQGLGRETINQEISNYLIYTNDEKVINHIMINYKEELVYNDLIYNDAPLPLIIFERKDIVRRLSEDDLINKLISLYKGTENLDFVFLSAVYHASEGPEDFLTNELKDKMINYFISDPFHLKDQYLKFQLILKLIRTNNRHNLLDSSDAIKILAFISNDMEDNIYINNIISTLLLEVDPFDYKEHKDYRELISLIKDIYNKSGDRLKKTLFVYF